MAPKFKGNSDDWLDDEGHTSGKRKRPKKSITARGTDLPLSDANATVIEVFPNQCRVQTDLDPHTLLCSYRWAEVISKSGQDARERTPVCVGDRVIVKASDSQSGVVEGLCTRKNCLMRPAPGRDGQKLHHALAANLDLLVIVASIQEPAFSPGLVDRFLVAAEAEGIPALIAMTKIDLVQMDQIKPVWRNYTSFGYSLVEMSAKTLVGFEILLKEIQGKTVAFCGQSGVGKTSLLRNLLGREIGRVSHVNETTGKGRHTTTGAVMLDGQSDSKWIDTPGVREFGLAKITPRTLADYYPEFRALECRNHRGCLHLDEVGCNAKDLYRYISYRRVLESLIAGEF